MTIHPGFDSLDEMESSAWLARMKSQFAANEWPPECQRCQLTEEAGEQSIRQKQFSRYDSSKAICEDYLEVNVDIDTTCDAACQHCSPNLSSYYSEISRAGLPPVTAEPFLETIDKQRVTEITVSGGEPSVGSMSKRFIESRLFEFPNLKKLRFDTNLSKIVPGLDKLLDNGLGISAAASMDRTENIYEYHRYPLEWDNFVTNFEHYLRLRDKHQNFELIIWYSWDSLTLVDLPAAITYAAYYGMEITGSALSNPNILQLRKTNFLTLATKEILKSETNPMVVNLRNMLATESNDSSDELRAFIRHNDGIRQICFDDYYKKYGIRL